MNFFLKHSVVTLVLYLPGLRDIADFRRARPHPYSIRILGVIPLDEIGDVVAPRSEDHKLIIRVIDFELV